MEQECSIIDKRTMREEKAQSGRTAAAAAAAAAMTEDGGGLKFLPSSTILGAPERAEDLRARLNDSSASFPFHATSAQVLGAPRSIKDGGGGGADNGDYGGKDGDEAKKKKKNGDYEVFAVRVEEEGRGNNESRRRQNERPLSEQREQGRAGG